MAFEALFQSVTGLGRAIFKEVVVVGHLSHGLGEAGQGDVFIRPFGLFVFLRVVGFALLHQVIEGVFRVCRADPNLLRDHLHGAGVIGGQIGARRLGKVQFGPLAHEPPQPPGGDKAQQIFHLAVGAQLQRLREHHSPVAL